MPTHITGDHAHFVRRAGQFDTATLAAATGMDLSFDHPGTFSKAFGPFPCAGPVVADVAVWDGDAELSQYCFGLVFMNVHN